jgi:hypothetical protein
MKMHLGDRCEVPEKCGQSRITKWGNYASDLDAEVPVWSRANQPEIGSFADFH